MKYAGLTKEQIAALSDENLLGLLTKDQKANVVHLTRATFPMNPPKKRDDESTGQYRQRCREAKEVDLSEYGRTLRQNAEMTLLAAQAPQRMIDALGADITRESVQKREAAEAERKEEERLHDLEYGGIGVVNPIVGWETGKDKK